MGACDQWIGKGGEDGGGWFAFEPDINIPAAHCRLTMDTNYFRWVKSMLVASHERFGPA
jgi:hypothetical protein